MNYKIPIVYGYMLGSTIFTSFIFYLIYTQGYAYLIEPNKTILTIELIAFPIGIILGIYYLFKELKII